MNRNLCIKSTCSVCINNIILTIVLFTSERSVRQRYQPIRRSVHLFTSSVMHLYLCTWFIPGNTQIIPPALLYIIFCSVFFFFLLLSTTTLCSFLTICLFTSGITPLIIFVKNSQSISGTEGICTCPTWVYCPVNNFYSLSCFIIPNVFAFLSLSLSTARVVSYRLRHFVNSSYHAEELFRFSTSH